MHRFFSRGVSILMTLAVTVVGPSGCSTRAPAAEMTCGEYLALAGDSTESENSAQTTLIRRLLRENDKEDGVLLGAGNVAQVRLALLIYCGPNGSSGYDPNARIGDPLGF